jgi:hypothetical protein
VYVFITSSAVQAVPHYLIRGVDLRKRRRLEREPTVGKTRPERKKCTSITEGNES